ncbi:MULTISPECIES: chemotaxis protein CheW [unclassified Candidatus Frackibacter]|uniref:chemotaxis protein CheW n=1 Tax=unclassified Candidatus Frackibacter TaxID=2648818 RepID=UPI000882D3F0|nr:MULTISPECIES: chemotaxis protein CheW [unclassified Candidatus Frackibacter]SDC68876.1 purine-binding chemotaxis protein CheW [Candidatus Frackibacter sp. WG11]SEM82847.1 purine-binding chemotaxis protein CheW [Candidatus Frackibacter sp. WG12]SFL92457.1 purine-binding chemotaxis protein CheW [Candidatus Frackibacter sp. WG13]
MNNQIYQLVIFQLSKEEFGIEITKIKEIIRMKEITKLPNSSETFLGIINLRGNIVPIVDLRKKFNLEEKLTNKSRIIIIEVDGQNIGIIVDSVSEVLRIKSDEIEDAPDKIVGIRNEYLKGLAKVKDRIIILCDLEKLLTVEEKINLKEISENVKEDTA